MDMIDFGQTGLNLSQIGLGTVKFGRNQGVKYPHGFDIPDNTHLRNLLALAKDLGINTLDTAPAYGTSEARLGTLLGGQRKDWHIVGKVGEEFENGESAYIFTPDHFEMSLTRSLKRLQTDYLDFLLIHSDGNDDAILDNDDVVQKMLAFKERGMVRALGMSTKTVSGGKRALDVFDCVMATYNPDYRTEEPVLDHAELLGKGVFLKKVLGSGHSTDPATALKFAARHPCNPVLVVGTITPEHLRDNVSALEV